MIRMYALVALAFLGTTALTCHQGGEPEEPMDGSHGDSHDCTAWYVETENGVDPPELLMAFHHQEPNTCPVQLDIAGQSLTSTGYVHDDDVIEASKVTVEAYNNKGEFQGQVTEWFDELGYASYSITYDAATGKLRAAEGITEADCRDWLIGHIDLTANAAITHGTGTLEGGVYVTFRVMEPAGTTCSVT